MLFQMRIANIMDYLGKEHSAAEKNDWVSVCVCLGLGVQVHSICTGSLYDLMSKPNIKIQVMFASFT